jgi:hypothetical protein
MINNEYYLFFSLYKKLYFEIICDCNFVELKDNYKELDFLNIRNEFLNELNIELQNELK